MTSTTLILLPCPGIEVSPGSRIKENYQRIFFAFYEGYSATRKLSEKIALPVVPNNTKQTLQSFTSYHECNCKPPPVRVRVPGKMAERIIFP